MSILLIDKKVSIEKKIVRMMLENLYISKNNIHLANLVKSLLKLIEISHN
jgi:hypothetical protein